MTARALEVQGRVMEALGDLQEALDQRGAEYAREYVRHVMDGDPLPYHRGLHHKVAHAIRDMVLDEALVAGRLPVAKR